MGAKTDRERGFFLGTSSLRGSRKTVKCGGINKVVLSSGLGFAFFATLGTLRLQVFQARLHRPLEDRGLFDATRLTEKGVLAALLGS